MKKLFLYIAILIFLFIFMFAISKKYFSGISKNVHDDQTEDYMYENTSYSETKDYVDSKSAQANIRDINHIDSNNVNETFNEYDSRDTTQKEKNDRYIIGFKNGYVIVYKNDYDDIYEYTDISEELLKSINIDVYNSIVSGLSFGNIDALFQFLQSISS